MDKAIRMEGQNRAENSAETMNKALLSLYESRLPELNYQIEQCIDECNWSVDKVSKLFLMKVEKEYAQARTKVLFVGRETFGWGQYSKLDSANDQVNFYENVSALGKHHKSPFWWFREKFSHQIGISKESFMKSTLWTNLSKIDVDKKKPTGKRFDQLLQDFLNLLAAEIEIINPDIVIIMTTDGFYNWHVNNYNWLENRPFNTQLKTVLTRSKNPITKIDRLIAEGRLPKHTYQICHPNAMQRQGVFEVKSNNFIQTILSAYNGESWG